jgi:hypothetical protein
LALAIQTRIIGDGKASTMANFEGKEKFESGKPGRKGHQDWETVTAASGSGVSDGEEYGKGSSEGEEFDKAQDEEPAFTKFPLLPIELRVNIWKDAMPSPRYVDIQTVKDVEWINYGILNKYYIWFAICKDNAPTLFFVDKEARAQVKRLYKPLKGTARAGAIWIDCQKDVLCAVDECSLKTFGTVLIYFPDEIRRSLTGIATDEDFLEKR